MFIPIEFEKGGRKSLATQEKRPEATKKSYPIGYTLKGKTIALKSSSWS